jgi:phosphoenolpyruvate---glycerone phosphotransferase subunit DhaL
MQAVALVDAAHARAALLRCCDALEAAAPELNALDARLGDGDLGTTLSKCAGNLRDLLAAPPATLDALLKGCAQACARASGSSFGTLLAVGFLAAAKNVGERPALDRDALVVLLVAVAEALSQRGGATPGDKTMIDSVVAIASALRDTKDLAPSALAFTARLAAGDALDVFRERPNRIGRARMFAERSIGLDDPGMVAVQRMVQAL